MDDTPTRLHRSILCRVAGAALLQPVLCLLGIVLPITLIARAAGPRGVPTFLVVATPVVLVVWLVGVSGHAEVDAQAIRWRYYLPHRIAWTDVERIRLVTKGMGWGVRHSIVVRARGRDHRITPAAPPGRGRIDFARRLFAQAEAHGVPAVNDGWVRT